MSQFFTSCSQSIAVSVSATVLPMNIQDWFPLGLTGWIALQSKGTLKSLLHSQTRFEKTSQWGEKRGLCQYSLGPCLLNFLQLLWFICFKLWGSGLCFTRIKDSSWAKEKPQKDGRKGKFTFRIKSHSLQRCSEGSNTPCAHQDPETPQRPRQNFVWEPPVEV